MFATEQETPETDTLLELRFHTQYNEKTGLLEMFNLGLVHSLRTPSVSEDICTAKVRTFHHVPDLFGIPSHEVGTCVHVLFRVGGVDTRCCPAMAYYDRQLAESAFSNAEKNLFESLGSRRRSCPGKVFSVVKLDRWHCDLLECVKTERGGWKRPRSGDTWYLRSLVIEELVT